MILNDVRRHFVLISYDELHEFVCKHKFVEKKTLYQWQYSGIPGKWQKLFSKLSDGSLKIVKKSQAKK